MIIVLAFLRPAALGLGTLVALMVPYTSPSGRLDRDARGLDALGVPLGRPARCYTPAG